MKTLQKFIATMTILSVVFTSCQKEVSFENDNNPSSGSLQVNGTGGCLGSTVGGSYKKDTTLNGTHYVDISVQVDTIGTYTITTDVVNGYSFSATGDFSNTGVQVVRLEGTGKPLAAGTNIFTVTYDGTTCDFSVTVSEPSGGTSDFAIDCPSAAIAGTYNAGTPMTSGNTIILDVNVTTAGTWNVTTSSVNGVFFTGTGNFAAAGPATITLTGNGTPTAGGVYNIPVVYKTNNCQVEITFTGPVPPPPFFWKFNESFLYQGGIDDATMASSMGITAMIISGTTSTGDTTLLITLADLAGGITVNEEYKTNATTSNSAMFMVTEGANTLYEADPSMTGVNLFIKITAHNVAAKVLEGTFSGNVKNGAGVTKAITAGQFKAEYTQ